MRIIHHDITWPLRCATLMRSKGRKCIRQSDFYPKILDENLRSRSQIKKWWLVNPICVHTLTPLYFQCKFDRRMHQTIFSKASNRDLHMRRCLQWIIMLDMTRKQYMNTEWQNDWHKVNGRPGLSICMKWLIKRLNMKESLRIIYTVYH